MEHKKQIWQGHPILGCVLLIVGILLLLRNIDVLNIQPIWKFWPLIFIAIGIDHLMEAKFTKKYYKAPFMLFLGTWLLISELNLFGLNYKNSWPIMIIGIGIVFLLKSIYYSNNTTILESQLNGSTTFSGEQNNEK